MTSEKGEELSEKNICDGAENVGDCGRKSLIKKNKTSLA